MPDVFAIYDSNGLENANGLLNAIESILRTGRSQHAARHVESTFAAINLLKHFSFAREQPFFDGNNTVFLDGALFDGKPISEIVRSVISKDPRALGSLNGQFNALTFDTKKNELALITDKLGSRPIYHARSGSRHVVSSEIKAIQAAFGSAFNISPGGLLELFAFAHNVGEKTVLDGVNVLPPGSIITIDSSGLRYARYFEFGYRRASETISAREWGECISSCLKTVIPKYLSGPTRKSIFLSGGLDSRIVAGAIGEASGGVTAYTFGDPGSQEVRSAREIAMRLEFPHKALPFPKNYLSSVLMDVVSRTECASPFYHTTSPVFHARLAEDTDVILVGFGGALSGSQIDRGALGISGSAPISDYLLKRKLCANPRDIARIFQPSFFKRHWGETIEAFHASVASIEEKNAADVAEVWGMANRQRRFTFAAPKVDRGQFEVAAPMLDNQYVELMASLPIEARWKQLAYRHAIVDGFPKLRGIPWAKTGREIPSGRLAFWADEALRVGSKALRKGVGRSLSGANIPKENYRSIADDIRRDEFLVPDYLNRYLTDGVLANEIFSREGITQLVERHMNGEDHSHLIGTVLTVGCYLKSITQDCSSS